MTQVTEKVKGVLSWYSNENNGVRTNLARMLMHGKLAGTGKLVIMPVDQGFEHGPDRSFAINPDAYDPEYHFKVAIQGGCNAYAAPLGMLEAAADKFTGQIPLILKLNSSYSLASSELSPEQVFTASVQDAMRLGCVGVGMTIYPGSNKFYKNLKRIKKTIFEAKSHGLAVVIWAYPRGEGISKEGQNAIDVCAYSGHIAALLGANIIKLKPPTNFIEKDEVKKIYQNTGVKTESLSDRIKHVMKAIMNHKRLVVFSGGGKKSDKDILDEIKMIAQGGGSGSIIGRNNFQRPFKESLELLQKICHIYHSQS